MIYGYRFGKQAQFGTGNTMTNDTNNIGIAVGSSNILSGNRVMIVGNNNTSLDGCSDTLVLGHGNLVTSNGDDGLIAGRFHNSAVSSAAAFGEGCDVTHRGSLSVGNYLATAAGGVGQGSAQHTTAVLKGVVTSALLTFTGSPSSADGSRTPGTYNDVAPSSTTGTGTGLKFNISVAAGGVATFTLVSGGTGVNESGTDTFTFDDSTMGSGGGAAVVLTVATINNSVVLMLADSNYLTIENGEAWTFRADVVGKERAGGGAASSYTAQGVLDRTTGTVSLLAAVTATTIFESDATPMGCTVLADDVNKSLEITYTGSDTGDIMEAVATVYMTKVRVSTA
jgi:hypothetical protein